MRGLLRKRDSWARAESTKCVSLLVGWQGMKEREKERKEAYFVLVSHPSTFAKLSLERAMAPVSPALCSILQLRYWTQIGRQ